MTRPATASMLQPEPGALANRPEDVAAHAASIADSMERSKSNAPDEILFDTFSGERIRCTGMDDTEVIDLLDGFKKQWQKYNEHFRATIASGERILEARMRARGARAIPHPNYVCELVDEYSTYAFDIEQLQAAREGLTEEEYAKVVRHIPEFVPPPIPAHDAPGNPVSIAALIKKYKGSDVAACLERGMNRVLLQTRFVLKAIPQKPKQVKAAEVAS